MLYHSDHNLEICREHIGKIPALMEESSSSNIAIISMVTNQNRLSPFQQLFRRVEKLPHFVIFHPILFIS